MPDLRGSQRYYSEGRRAKLFLRKESSYGELYDEDNNDFLASEPLGIVPGTVITKDRSYIQPDVLTGSPSMVEGLLGKTTVGGSYAFYMAHPYSKSGSTQQTTLRFLEHAFGIDTISYSSGTPATYTLNQDLPNEGLGFLQVLEGSRTDIHDYSYAAYFSGTRINGLTINVPSVDSAITMAFDFMCKDGEFFDESDSFIFPTGLNNWDLNSGTSITVDKIVKGNAYKIVSTGTTTTTQWQNLGSDASPLADEVFTALIDGNTTMGDGTVVLNKFASNYIPAWSTEVILSKVGDTNNLEYQFAFSNLSLNFNNNLQPISFIDGNDSVTDFNRGRRNVNGSFTLPLFYANATTNTTQFLKEFFESTNYKLTVRLNAEASNKWIEFIFPNIVWSTSPAPRNLNQGHAELNMNFIAYPEKDTGGSGFKKNTEFSLRIN